MIIKNQGRQRSKSTRRMSMKSPLTTRVKNQIDTESKEKVGSSKNSTKNIQRSDNEKKILTNLPDNLENNIKKTSLNKNKLTTDNFKNKLIVNSYEFNKLKQKLQSVSSGTSTPRHTTNQTNKKLKQPMKIKVKILDQMTNKSSSNTSDRTKSQTETTGTLESQQIQMLKVENEYFKKIYDQALDELSKLKNKLKQQKKVHDVQKQIYQNQINKLKRIVDTQKQEVSHIICDQEGKCMIVVSQIQNEKQMDLGLDSDCGDDHCDQSGNISINSNK